MSLPFSGNNPRSTRDLLAWHGQALREAVLDPQLPIVDTHHHLYGLASDDRYYRIQDLTADVSGGHALIGTVYVEGYQSAWRETGPESLRPVGEVDMIVGATPTPTALKHGACQLAAGVVGHADLLLGDEVVAVLEALRAASQGRLRGVRYMTAWDGGTVGASLAHMPPRGVMADARFRRGLARLREFDLNFDVWVYHHQLRDVIDLVDAFPDQRIVLDHVGGLIGVAEHRRSRTSAFVGWVRDLTELARRPNVSIKIGGLGMPVFGFGFEDEGRPATSLELAQAWQPLIDACVETFGPRRCLFETNFPVDKQSAGYTQIWNAYKRATRQYSSDERRDLFYRTACDTYCLPELKKTGDMLT